VTNNTVRAYDGRTGTQLWLKNSLANGIVLPVSHGRAANVLIRDTLGRSVVVAGADGSEHVVTAPQSLFSTQVALGDVDRDGNADFAIFTSPWNCDACSRSKLDAYSTATGRTLWSRVWRGPGLDSVTPIVDATGDGSADLIVRFTEPSYFEHSDVLVNGATGASPFTVPWRTYLFAVGDVNGDRHTDLVWSYHDGRRYPFEARSGVTGAVLWRAPFIPSSDPESDVLGPIGDVNADGVQEVGHGTAYGWVEPVEAFLDGRTGAATSEYRGTPLRASIDATGDDFADVVATGQQSWSVVATEGRTGSRLYAVPTPGFDYAPLTASDVTGDGKAEVFGYFIPAHRTGPDGTLLVIDGATHQVRWSAKP
jgi:hypothetical protein